jgi:hypothetical protein
MKTPSENDSFKGLVRGVRIGTSVFFGLVTVVLVVLWVRSYWYLDYLEAQIVSTHNVTLNITAGVTSISVSTIPVSNFKIRICDWQAGTHLRSRITNPVRPSHQFEYYWNRDWKSGHVLFPGWLPALLAAGIAAGCWSPVVGSFSLRILFAITTLVAVVLGAVVWAAAG